MGAHFLRHLKAKKKKTEKVDILGSMVLCYSVVGRENKTHCSADFGPGIMD